MAATCKVLENLNVKDENQTIITETTNFVDYTMVLIQRFLQSRLFMNDMTNTIPYELRIYSGELTIDYIETNLKSAEKRRETIEEGSQKMPNFNPSSMMNSMSSMSNKFK